MINPERVMANFKDIDEASEQLYKIRKISFENFLNNPDYRYIAYASFIILIESMIDICYHIAVKNFKLIPESYGECFELLKRKGVFNAELSDSLSAMARFRNLLIHRYKKVDFKKVYDYIENLNVVEKFKSSVMKLMKEKTDEA